MTEFKRDVINSRIAVLKAMDNAIRNMNDEEAFDPWLMCGVPDGSDDDDYESIAENTKEYVETVKLFAKIVKLYADEDF
jgi:hypothetical protein